MHPPHDGPDGEHALCPKCNDVRTFKKYPLANRRTSWSCTACVVVGLVFVALDDVVGDELAEAEACVPVA